MQHFIAPIYKRSSAAWRCSKNARWLLVLRAVRRQRRAVCAILEISECYMTQIWKIPCLLKIAVKTYLSLTFCSDSDPKCYNPRVLKSLCHEKRHRSETAKQFFRSSHFNCRVTAQQVDSEHDTGPQPHSTDDDPHQLDHKHQQEQQ